MAAPLTFGSWLKRRRQGLGFTQKELARQVGYAPVTLCKVEADELRPSGQMAKKLAETLELTPEEQAQFVRFARDEAYWDDLTLPGGTALLPTAAPSVAQKANLTQDDRPAEPDTAAEPVKLRHNLPALTTALIGRDEELAELAQLLADPATRLVTILSAGGMGKSSLAIAAAAQQIEQYPDGVCWVPLAPVTEAKDLGLALAAALELQVQGERTPEQQVGDFLRTKHLLLVLDNFEHLLERASLVGELLAEAPQVAILVTSRRRLNLSSETVIFLDGLRFPADEASDPLDYPAMELFLLHARRVHPHYQPGASDVVGMVEICRLVHGMPLGILLAAAWSRAIAPSDIAAEIGRDLSFLQTDMQDIPVRQRHLRAVFMHTWNRLSAAARQVFMRLSVFRGGASAQAARQVTGATAAVLAELIDMALLRRLPNGRYEIHELLRQFAAEQLAGSTGEGGQREAQQQHTRYFLGLLAAQGQHLQSLQQSTALTILYADNENIGVAWRWAVQQHEFALIAPAVHALFLYCEARGDFSGGARLFAAARAELDAGRAADIDDKSRLQAIRAQLSVRLGACEVHLSNFEFGEQLLQDGLQASELPRERAFALVYLGLAHADRGDLPLSRARLQDSLALSRANDDNAGIARALLYLLQGQSDYAQADRLCSESLVYARRSERPDLIAHVLIYLGFFKGCLGEYAAASACWQEGLELCEQLGLRNEKAWALDCLGVAAWCQGDMAGAERYIVEALAIYTHLGRQTSIAMCLADLTPVLIGQGEVQRAITVAQRAVAMTRAVNGQNMLTVSLCYLGAALIAAGDLVEARRTLIEATRRAWQCEYIHFVMIAFYHFGELLIAESHGCEPAAAMEHRIRAAELLTCVRTHIQAWQIFRDKATALLGETAGLLPPAVLAAAVEAGTNRTIAELVNALLGSQPTGSEVSPAFFQRSTADAEMYQVMIEPLSARELAILQLVAAGCSNREVAAQLVITEGTAKWYVSQVLGKLGVQSRTQAVARGRELGLLG
jgi:predicted ATPase/DNA-binding CsgD family transcriptional regulator/DNA-binding XRE family transcriptional regulator